METETLSVDKIHEKLSKLNEMKAFYRYMEKGHMVEQIQTMIDSYQFMLQEKYDLDYYDEFIGRNSGVVIDTGKEKEKPDEKPNKSRRRTFGGIVQ